MIPRNRRQAVIFAAGIIAAIYIVYRAIFTLNLTTTYAVFASLFLFVAEFYGVISMILYFLQVWEVEEPDTPPLLEDRTVDVFIPTYNEDLDLLRVTIKAAVQMDYPHQTYVCDDGGTEQRRNAEEPEKAAAAMERHLKLKALCEELGAVYITRAKNVHAKAGNLNHAFELTEGEFLIILDADHVPEPHFITRMIGYFADEKLAFVQSPHAFYNFDSYQARHDPDRNKYWEEGQLFYNNIQPGRNSFHCPIFAGSAAMFRRSALAEVGYIAVETITEDMHTGLRMHGKGWKSLAVTERLVAGQAAPDVTTFHTQRLRWGEGNLSVFFHDNPVTMPGLRLSQRLCYLATMINWLGGLFKLPIYLTPILMLFTGVPPVNEFTWTLGVLMSVYMFACIFGTRVAGNGYGSMWYSELFTMAGFWTQARGAMKALFWRKFQTFVVTSKRGKQSDSIWPFIKPQVYLIAVTLIAMSWAWGRVVFGISDDVFKPVLASFWATFHAMLAYLVIRRAFWPDERRYSTRHTVHLPAECEWTDADGELRKHLGMTFDLNDLGVGLITYEPLAPEARVRVRLHGMGNSVECEAEVRWSKELSGNGTRGYKHGLKFHGLVPTEADTLNLICLHYAVPRLYHRYAEGHQQFFRAAFKWFTHRFGRKRFFRRENFHLPVVLNDEPAEAVIPAVTDDLNQNAIAVMLDRKLDVGDTYPFRMGTPLGEVTGIAKVSRVRKRIIAARPYSLSVLEFEHFDGDGRALVQSLFVSEVKAKAGPVLRPRRQAMPVLIDKPLLRALAMVLPVLVLEYTVFRYAYADNFFLRETAIANRQLTAEEVERVDRIYGETMGETYPSTDRLVLLSHVYQRLGRADELAAVARILAPRDRDNLDLQIALAQALDQREEYDAAIAKYRDLLADLDAGDIPESRREPLVAGAARAALHAGEVALATEWYERLIAMAPEKRRDRNEYAGAMLGAGEPRRVVRAYAGVAPDYDGRVLLVLAYSRAGDRAAAEREARRLARDYPEDANAEALLADVLSSKGDHRQAREIYARLIQQGKADPKIAAQLAHAALWNKNYDEALGLFESILGQSDGDPGFPDLNPDLVRGFVNAAAGATALTDAHGERARALYEHTLTDAKADPVYLARLGWVLQRAGEYERSAALLERALSLAPDDDALRRQLVGALVQAGRGGEALELLRGHESELDSRSILIDIQVAAGDFDAAIEQTRTILASDPDHEPTRLRMADILSWAGKYPESLKLFRELAAEHPGNREYPIRIAEVTLWSGDHDEAVRLYGNLLGRDFGRAELWYGFIDAAASAGRLDRSAQRLARTIAARAMDGDHMAPRVKAWFRDRKTAPDEAAFLTRTAWVFLKHHWDSETVRGLLDLALALQPDRPEMRKELAGVLAAAGRYDEAIAQFKGLTLGPSDRLNLARIYSAAGGFTAAEGLCREAILGDPLNDEARRLLADILSWDGRHAEALALFGQLLEANPDDPSLLLRRAETVLWSGDHERALVLLSDMVDRDPTRPSPWPGFLQAASRAEGLTPRQRQLAARVAASITADPEADAEALGAAAIVQLAHLGLAEEARATLARALTKAPKDVSGLARLAERFRRAGDPKQAAVLLDRALALDPTAPARLLELADGFSSVGRFQTAGDLLDRLDSSRPDEYDLRDRFARLDVWSGRHAEGLRKLERLLGENFDRPELWADFINAAGQVGDLTSGQLTLVTRIADQPRPADTGDGEALFNSRVGWTLWREAVRTADPAIQAKAGRFIERAVELDPKAAEARAEIAGVLVATGRVKQALPWLEQVAKDNPEDRAAQTRLAEVLHWAGEHKRSLAILETLIGEGLSEPGLWPTFAGAAAAIGEGQLTDSQTELARQLAREPVPRAATEPATYLARLAWVLIREGHGGEGGPLLDRVIAMKPDDRAMDEVAGILTAAGRFDTAHRWLQDLLTRNPEDVNLRSRLAGVTLWGGDPEGALLLLADLLGEDPGRSDLWESFADATGQASVLTADHRRLLEHIAAQPLPEVNAKTPLVLSRLAWALHRAGGPAETVAGLLDRAVGLEPEGSAREEIAGVLIAVGRVKHAVPWLEAMADADPSDPKLRVTLARALVWAGEPAKALPRLRELLAEDFDRPELWVSFVDAASAVGKGVMSEADVTLIERLAGTPVPEEAAAPAAYLSRLAWALAREDRAEEAGKLLDRAVALNPEGPVKAEVAGVLTAVGRFDLAARWLRELAAADPDDPTLKARLAKVTLWSGDAAEALSGLTAILSADVDQPDLWEPFVEAAGQAAGPLSDEQKGILARLADQPGSDSPLYLSRLAWALHRSGGDPASVGRLLDQAIAAEPAGEARSEVAGVLIAVGRTGQALPWLEQMAAANPEDEGFQVTLAQALVWGGEPAKALPRLRALLKQDFDRPSLWVSFADAAAGVGRGVMTAEDVTLVERIAASPVPEEAPEPALHLSRLAWVLTREGHPDKAAPLLTRAVESAPKDAATRRELAGMLTAAGRFDQALTWLEEISAADPDDRDLREEIAEVTLWSGDATTALERLTALLRADFQSPRLWRSYVDAASPLNKGELTAEQVRLAERIAREPLPVAWEDPTPFLARLAWVLAREGKPAEAAKLLDRAVALGSRESDSRRELGRVLAAVGRGEDALKMFEGLTLTAEDRIGLISLHAAAKNFARAAEQARAILAENPGNLPARRWLADVTLWGGDYVGALSLYQELLAENVDQPALWPGFTEAAAKADRLTPEQVALVRGITGRRPHGTDDVVFLARLALLSKLYPQSGEGGETAGEADRLFDAAIDGRPEEPLTLSRLAWLAHRFGRAGLAGDLIDQAVALEATEPAVRRELGDVMVATNREKRALPWFEQLAADHPEDAELKRRLAQVTVWAGEYKLGLSRLLDILGAEFDHPELWPVYADAAAAVDGLTRPQLTLAARLAERSLPTEDAAQQALFRSRLAWTFLRESKRTPRSDFRETIRRLLDEALALKPEPAKARLEIAGVLTAAQRFEEALAIYERLGRESPGDPDVELAIVQLLQASGRSADALARLTPMLDQNSNRTDLWPLFVDAASGAGRLSSRQLRTLTRIADADDAETTAVYRSRLAWALLREGKSSGDRRMIARAEELLDRALASPPADAADRRELAGVLSAAGKNDEALNLLTGLAHIGPDDHATLADVYAASRRLDDAEREAREALRLKPDDPDAKFRLANILGWNGKPRDAEKLYRELQKVRPDDVRLAIGLAQMALWDRDYDAALERYSTLLGGEWEPAVWKGFIDAAASAEAFSPRKHRALVVRVYNEKAEAIEEPTLMARLAWVMRRIGEPAASVALLERAVAADPDSRELRLRLAQALTDAGRYAEAEQHYRVLLRSRRD